MGLGARFLEDGQMDVLGPDLLLAGLFGRRASRIRRPRTGEAREHEVLQASHWRVSAPSHGSPRGSSPPARCCWPSPRSAPRALRRSCSTTVTSATRKASAAGTASTAIMQPVGSCPVPAKDPADRCWKCRGTAVC